MLNPSSGAECMSLENVKDAWQKIEMESSALHSAA